MKQKLLTLGFIIQGNKILLCMKKRGFGAGKWNGFGGKVEVGESTEECIARECFEEISVEPLKISHCGTLNLEYKHKGETLKVEVFLIEEYKGEPEEGEEVRPEWFDLDKIPYEKCWADDKYWMPVFLDGKKFEADFVFTDFETIEDHVVSIRP